MSLKSNCQKFKEHLKSRGILYAFWRGIKYSLFLIKQRKDVITEGRIKIICSYTGLNFCWNSYEVTKDVGLNVGIKTLGIWTDSSKAQWQVIERGKNYFKIKIILKELPLNQTWTIKLEKETQIYCKVDMETEEELHIDEIRLICMVNSKYKTWINGYRQGNFSRLGNYWEDLSLDDFPSSLVGVKSPIGGEPLPSFILESEDNDNNLLPVIQKTPSSINAYMVGFKKINPEEKRDHARGHYCLFSGKISLFEKEYLLDDKIESLRQDYLKTALARSKNDRKSKAKLKVLLVNLPWQKQANWGVRAGSRWPHIKDRSEGNYLPFPFFLAYATSLLRKNNIDANLIDAIAEQIPEDKFLDNLSRMDLDILVAETSVPSFYYDMKLLKKTADLGISVILCGPHSEIYKTEFLKQNRFIDFVLFGEYEFTLLELIKAISQAKRDFSSIRGLIWKNDNSDVVKNLPRPSFNINNLPWPHRDTLPIERYWDLPGDIPYPSVQMVASRGCPFGCNFCLWPQVLFGGRNYRARDTNDIIDEMEYLVKEKGFKSAYFDDDVFNIGRKRILEFCAEITRRGLNRIPWAVMAKADLMDEELLEELKKAGLYAIKYGVETASQELLERCGKCLDLKKTEKVIKYTKSLGIKVHLTFLFGLEGETMETIKRTIDYSLKLAPDSVQYSILTPFPGTEIFNKLDRENRIITKNWSLYDGHHNCVFQPESLTSVDLERAKQYAYRLWLNYQRKKRGLQGNAKKLFEYLFSYRRKFIGRI